MRAVMPKWITKSVEVSIQDRDDFFSISESDKVLQKLQKIPSYIEEGSFEIYRIINKAFTNTSAHVRAKCLDILALWCKPLLCLAAGTAGDLVLWHNNDGDSRVRDRAYYCLLHWLSILAPKATSEIYNCLKVNISMTHCQMYKQDILLWFESNIESVYASACRGLLDNEELVRRTSLHVLGHVSTLWPHRELVGFSLCKLSLPTSHSSIVMCESDYDSEPVRLVDDAFSRVCVRLQDSSRRVRQLAAEIMSDLAKSVAEDSLLQTLEKTVMSDRQVRRSMLVNQPGSQFKQSNGQNSTEPVSSSSINLLSTGSNGAIITGLEDDYFEVRCTTLTTVTRIASLNTRFAMNCQDLLVDMLMDDIQDVRFAAVRALCAVGDKVPVKAEQISIITSALAEGSGRIRRRLHHLLSQCRLASAPCLISLLDGLLQNLQKYPQDRDNLWCCAALVGRNHPNFVHICLSSLLRTHSWLNGPEPNKEDPAYLTVLLLVLNAEPSVPGMQSKFPRHLASTKVYLREFLPSLLPQSTRTSLMDSIIEDRSFLILSKHQKQYAFDNETGHLHLMTDHHHHTERLRLYKFVHFTIGKIRDLLLEVRDELDYWDPNRKCLCTTTDNNNDDDDDNNNNSNHYYCNNESHFDQPMINGLRIGIRSTKSNYARQHLLARLVFGDLCDRAQQLDRTGHLQGLISWLSLIATIAWCLISVSSVYFDYSSDRLLDSKRIKLSTESNVVSSSINHKRIMKLLTKAFRNSLKAEYFFRGKTSNEHDSIVKLRLNLYSTLNSFAEDHLFMVSNLIDAQNVLIQLLTNPIESNPRNCTNSHRKRPYPFRVDGLARIGGDDDDTGLEDENKGLTYLMDLVNRLQPIQAFLLQPHGFGTNPDNHRFRMNLKSNLNQMMGDSEDKKPDRIGFKHAKLMSVTSNSTNIDPVKSIPEVRFTATLASCSIRIQSIVVGLDLDVAREHVCIIFRRPDIVNSSQIQSKSDDLMNKSMLAHTYHQWWPPISAWHLIDEDYSAVNNLSTTTTTTSSSSSSNNNLNDKNDVVNKINSDQLEIRTYMELSANCWSDAGTIELGLGFCLHPKHYSGPGHSSNSHILLPLTSCAQVKLIPTAAINHSGRIVI